MAARDVSVVLAHGAWADGSSWAPVITALKAESAKVVAAPLPLTSLADDVAALNRSLDRTEGPIVVAGHAYAGAVIALARPERVKALVYVTALAPDEGEKVADVLSPRTSSPSAKACTGLRWSDLASRGSLRERFRAECNSGRASGARCRAAADIAELHYCSCRAPALEGHPDLVSARRRRSDDRP
jgi:pimeloyl-ACP methyl ester carboxylesterase